MKHKDIKQHIIEVASSLFYKNGYNATGINEIIATAKIAKATLYNHFKSKEEICLSYLKYKNTTFLRDIRSYCESAPNGKKRVLAIYDFLDDFFKDQDFNGCWCIKTVAEIPKENLIIRNEIQQQKKLFLKFIIDLLEKNTTLKPIKLKSISKQLYLLYESAVGESHLHQHNWPITEAKKVAKVIIEL